METNQTAAVIGSIVGHVLLIAVASLFIMWALDYTLDFEISYLKTFVGSYLIIALSTLAFSGIPKNNQ